MSKLGELRREEEKAQLELEKAEREAQKIGISIPGLLEEQNRERQEQLREIARQAEAEVEIEIEKLSMSLSSGTEEQLRKLAEKKEVLEKAATERLREYILKSGSESK